MKLLEHVLRAEVEVDRGGAKVVVTEDSLEGREGAALAQVKH